MVSYKLRISSEELTKFLKKQKVDVKMENMIAIYISFSFDAWQKFNMMNKNRVTSGN
jgi:hypothetical protein